MAVTHRDTVADWDEATEARLRSEYATTLRVDEQAIVFTAADVRMGVEIMRQTLLHRVKERFPGSVPIANALFGIADDDYRPSCAPCSSFSRRRARTARSLRRACARWAIRRRKLT